MKAIKKVMALVIAMAVSCLFCFAPLAVAAGSANDSLTGEYLQQLMNLAQSNTTMT
jgi:hypothetical protein